MPPHTETSVGWSSFHSRGLDLILIFYAQVLEGQLAKNAGIKKKKRKMCSYKWQHFWYILYNVHHKDDSKRLFLNVMSLKKNSLVS